MKRFLADIERAVVLVDINVAAGLARERLELRRRHLVRNALWAVVLVLLVSDLLPIGPLDLGLLPDVHIFTLLTGHPYGVAAGRALYHVNPESPHFLGVTLPWGQAF